MHLVGRLNRNIYKCIAEDIVTDDVVLTENQIQHISERHPETYEKVVDFLECAIEDPDYIIEDKHPKTGLIIKEYGSAKKNTCRLFYAFAHLGIYRDIKIRLSLAGRLVKVDCRTI